MRPILVADDGSDAAAHAVKWARTFAVAVMLGHEPVEISTGDIVRLGREDHARTADNPSTNSSTNDSQARVFTVSHGLSPRRIRPAPMTFRAMW